MASPAIAVQDLRVERGRREVLHGVTLEVPRGRVVGLLGPSGCGKTTLMRAILGVQVVKAGTVTVLGLPAGSQALRRRVGYSPQSPAIYADLTVWENLSYFSAVLNAAKGDAARVVREAGLDEVAGQVVATLSGGELSRASLAVALLAEPELLVLDEPTVGLDPVLRNELWGFFHRLADERQVTLLISTHVMDEADRCQRLVLMREGQVLADDSPDVLRATAGTGDLDAAFLHFIGKAT